jgi:transposase
MTDGEMSAIFSVSLSTIHRIRQKFVNEGLDETLSEKPRSGRPKVFSGTDLAKITALACSDPPEGNAKWSMRLIADKAVELEYVDTISYQTVHNMLKKTNFHHTSKGNGASAS